MRHAVAAIALAISTMPALADGPHGTRCKASPAAFAELKTGMLQAHVAKVIGCPGVILSESNAGRRPIVMVAWDAMGPRGANMTVMFRGGQLISKSQAGMR